MMTTKEATRLVGVLGRFAAAELLADAAQALRADGHRRLEAFTPHPVHGLDKALGLRPTRLPWVVLAAGAAGAAAAVAGQWWTNAVDYPFVVSGKPLFSLPANIPVAFEVVILLSAFAAFFGMLAFNGLPQLTHPLLRQEAFRRATTDRFYLLVPPEGAAWDAEAAAERLRALGAEEVTRVAAPVEPARLPRWVWAAAVLGAAAATIPPLWIAMVRGVKSAKPRWHTFTDMDYQPKFRAQAAAPATLFPDGRAARTPPEGAVAWGRLEEDPRFYQGVAPEGEAAAARDEPFTLAAASSAAAAAEPSDREAAPAAAEPNWVRTPPLPVTEELMRRGRERYNIYCSPCHGRAGDGDGLVALRAAELEQPTWVPPTSLHADHVRAQPAGQLFHTITSGVRKMPGYAAQIPVRDRWAIVLYVRALQRARHARLEDVPPDQRSRLRGQ